MRVTSIFKNCKPFLQYRKAPQFYSLTRLNEIQIIEQNILNLDLQMSPKSPTDSPR